MHSNIARRVSADNGSYPYCSFRGNMIGMSLLSDRIKYLDVREFFIVEF
jgi:hypothetical protein